MMLGNAPALTLDQHIGSIETGKEADLVVLDSRATPAMAHRMEAANGDIDVELFALITMGDDRAVRQTYVAGAPSKSPSREPSSTAASAGLPTNSIAGVQRSSAPLRECQPTMPPA